VLTNYRAVLGFLAARIIQPAAVPNSRGFECV